MDIYSNLRSHFVGVHRNNIQYMHAITKADKLFNTSPLLIIEIEEKVVHSYHIIRQNYIN